jgi:GAF domain
MRQVTSNMGDIFSAGDRFDLCDTYCAAVAKEDKTVTYIQVGIIPEMIIHPVYKAVQLESYIGSPIHDRNGKVTGTVNFSSHKVRNKDFDNAEIELVAQMAIKLSDVLYG